MSIDEAFKNWRRNTFPASKNDVDGRAGEIIGRIDHLQNCLDALWLREIGQGAPESQRPVLHLLKLISPLNANGVEKIRIGSDYDGGYVQLDDTELLKLGLSFGVCDDDNWDVAMAEKGIPVHQFDHTIESAPSTHKLMTFHRKKACARSSGSEVSLSELVAQAPEGSPTVILKMDIEGDEWNVLDATSEKDLSKIAQLVCEFHDLSRLHETGFYCRALRVFEKLNSVFAPIHVHGNNFASLVNVHNIPVPDVIEISFASRSLYSFSASDEIFPTPLDAPNNPAKPDIFLGRFQF